MTSVERCPECGAAWREGVTCQDHYHQMLAWEMEDPRLGVVHHLMVLCYHLQHPSLYTPEGLIFARQLLVDFVVEGVTPEEVRWRNRARLDSRHRTWKISKGVPGAYARPVQWTMTAADATAGGMAGYCDSVRAWARSVHAALAASGNPAPD
jgi:hypothetical protein